MKPEEVPVQTIVTATVGRAQTQAEMRDALATVLSSAITNHRIHWEHHSITSMQDAEPLAPHAILAAPPSSTWTRARHLAPHGPPPLRDSDWPWGDPRLKGKNRDLVEHENSELRLALTFIDTSLKRRPDMTWFLIFPEDRGRGAHGLPASIWQLKELRAWATSQAALRGAINQCEFGPAPTPRPLAFLKHSIDNGCLTSTKGVHAGWPKFSSSTTRHYIGPLPRKCNCGRIHQPWRRQALDKTSPPSSTLANVEVAEWFARQVMQPHLRRLSSSALLRQGSHQDRARPHQSLSRSAADLEHDTALSDSGTDGTWPEADEAFPENNDGSLISKRAYVDRQLVDLLGIQDSFKDDMLLQDNFNQAPSPIRSRAAK